MGLYLQQLELFSKLPQVVTEIVLNNMKTKYYKPGDTVHGGGPAPFMGVIFTGTLISKINKQTIIFEKNTIVMPGAFYKQSYEPLFCKDETIILALDKEVYQVIVKRLREEIETKERD